ncbi:MAG: hypothetical protein JWN45_3561 [Acidobacteriaceae bacterium]|nr:hypothetical protein [Acidobacteriaceae bacterium]
MSDRPSLWEYSGNGGESDIDSSDEGSSGNARASRADVICALERGLTRKRYSARCGIYFLSSRKHISQQLNNATHRQIRPCDH